MYEDFQAMTVWSTVTGPPEPFVCRLLEYIAVVSGYIEGHGLTGRNHLIDFHVDEIIDHTRKRRF